VGAEEPTPTRHQHDITDLQCVDRQILGLTVEVIKLLHVFDLKYRRLFWRRPRRVDRDDQEADEQSKYGKEEEQRNAENESGER
jgi:hypothetical protein